MKKKTFPILLCLLGVFIQRTKTQTFSVEESLSSQTAAEEAVRLQDVSLQKDHYDSSGARTIRTAGISSKLLNRIHSVDCVGIHALALDLLETNRYNQNILIHNLRKYLSQKEAEGLSNISAQRDLSPSPSLKLPSHEKIEETRASNLQRSTQRVQEAAVRQTQELDHLSKEEKENQQKSKGPFQHFAQVKSNTEEGKHTVANQNAQKLDEEAQFPHSKQEDIDITDEEKDIPESHFESRGQAPSLAGNTEEMKDLEFSDNTESKEIRHQIQNKSNRRVFHQQSQMNRNSNNHPREKYSQQSHRDFNRQPAKIIQTSEETVGSISHPRPSLETNQNINTHSSKSQEHSEETKRTLHQRQKEQNNQKGVNVQQNFENKEPAQSDVNKEPRALDSDNKFERSRRENSGRRSSRNQGATSIENFLQRYPEIRRISSRFSNNETPSRVLKGAPTKASSPETTPRTKAPTTVAQRSTQRASFTTTRRVQRPTPTVRQEPATTIRDETSRSPQTSTTPSASKPLQTRIPAPVNDLPDFDNAEEELSSADYSYLYYQDYYDELVPPHHRFQQLKNKRPQQVRAPLSQGKNTRHQSERHVVRRPSNTEGGQVRQTNVRRPNHQGQLNSGSTSLNERSKSPGSLNQIPQQTHASKSVENKRKALSKKEEDTHEKESSSLPTVSVGPFGYTEKGEFFTDESVNTFPEAIDLTYQGFVWALTMIYPDKEKRVHGGIHAILKDKVKEKKINLKGDHIIRVSGRASPYNINRLTFYMSSGKVHGPFGERQHKESQDFDEAAPEGSALAYISGTINFGVPLRSIGLHWRPISSPSTSS